MTTKSDKAEIREDAKACQRQYIRTLDALQKAEVDLTNAKLSTSRTLTRVTIAEHRAKLRILMAEVRGQIESFQYDIDNPEA